MGKLTKRVSLAKVERFLAGRAEAIKAEMRHYEQQSKDLPDQRDFYERMAATERCAWMEVLHCREVILGEKFDARWEAAGRAALSQNTESGQ